MTLEVQVYVLMDKRTIPGKQQTDYSGDKAKDGEETRTEQIKGRNRDDKDEQRKKLSGDNDGAETRTELRQGQSRDNDGAETRTDQRQGQNRDKDGAETGTEQRQGRSKDKEGAIP